jgi:hypothetical protein
MMTRGSGNSVSYIFGMKPLFYIEVLSLSFKGIWLYICFTVCVHVFLLQDSEEAIVTLIQGCLWDEALRMVRIILMSLLCILYFPRDHFLFDYLHIKTTITKKKKC